MAKSEKPNNEQINGTDYYRLPCGRFLEDFIAAQRLSFAMGSALKYAWRAGHKDGESREKDLAKRDHYIEYLARTRPRFGMGWAARIDQLVSEATKWDGGR